MLKSSLILSVMAAIAVNGGAKAYGQEAVAFRAERGIWPVPCLLESGREWQAGEEAQWRETTDWQGKTRSILSFEGEKIRGVRVKMASDGSDPLQGELEALTIALRVAPAPMQATTLFLWRIHASTKNPGFISFNLQANVGDDEYRTGTFRFTVQGEGEESVTVASSEGVDFQRGQWRHVAMTFQAGMVTFYVDGERLGEPRAMTVEKIPAVDARAYLAMAMFTGMADEMVVIPGRALSGEEIGLLAGKGLATPETQTVLKKK